jgi:2-polyprenyl-3-methyl-5-hydroxy-6-metoxy-1,4-benzoquinol methylase
MVARALASRHNTGGTVLDVGCGAGRLRPYIADRFDSYAGADVVRYDAFPADAAFHPIDLDAGRVPLPDGNVDVVVAVETVEHLENPRAFFRELTRIAKPGGTFVVTTPNQLSLLAKLGLVFKNNYPAFAGSNYPAHLTALLEIDLRRMAAECGWSHVGIEYTHSGRIPGTPRHWPGGLSRIFPRSLSDNVLIAGRPQ